MSSCWSIFSFCSLFRLSSAMFLFVFSSATCSRVCFSSVAFSVALVSFFISLLFSAVFDFKDSFSSFSVVFWSSSSWILIFKLSISICRCSARSLASWSFFSIFSVVSFCLFLCFSSTSFSSICFVSISISASRSLILFAFSSCLLSMVWWVLSWRRCFNFRFSSSGCLVVCFVSGVDCFISSICCFSILFSSSRCLTTFVCALGSLDLLPFVVLVIIPFPLCRVAYDPGVH